MIEVNIDLSGLGKLIARKSLTMRKSLKVAMKEEGGLLALTLIKYTQPFGTSAKARGEGESAIKGDLAEAFYILPDSLCSGRTIIHDNGAYDGYIRIFARKNGTVYACPPENWRVAEDISSLHFYWNSLRTKDGRVRKAHEKIRTDRHLQIIQLWVITQSQLNGLMNLVYPRVGWAKAGWATVCAKLGRTNSDVPEWIKRHAGESPGSIIDNTDAAKPSLTMINEVDYTGHVLSQSAKREAIAEREKKLKLSIDRAIKYGVKEK